MSNRRMSTARDENEETWLRDLLAAAGGALVNLRARAAPENQALQDDLERFCRELEDQLGERRAESS